MLQMKDARAPFICFFKKLKEKHTDDKSTQENEDYNSHCSHSNGL